MSKGTRRNLLEGAERILIEAGVHALTVRRIGSACGLNPALVTYHFGSVAGLLGELLRANLDLLAADWALLDDPVPAGVPPVDAYLERWLTPLTRSAAFVPTGRALVVLDEIAAHGDAQLSNVLMSSMREVSLKVQSRLAPHLPHLGAEELRARLRFLAGAALGPPPRNAVAHGRLSPVLDSAQLVSFARAALG